MQKRVGLAVCVLVAGLLIPYIAAMMAGEEDSIPVSQVAQSGKTVTLQSSGNRVDAEEYLIGLVAAAIPADYEMEAVKAQAVMERTYLYKAMDGKDNIEEEDLSREPWTIKKMEEKWGRSRFQDYYDKIGTAVGETVGMVLTYEGQLIDALYHRIGVGKTRSDTSGLCPYLVSRDSPWDLEAEGCLQVRVYSEEEFSAAINTINPEAQVAADQILSTVQAITKDENGYITLMQIGGYQFSAVQVAEALDVYSTCMTFEEYEGGIRVSAKGIGQGYGVSQYGANQMAREGKTWEDILKYYYQNIAVTSV